MMGKSSISSTNSRYAYQSPDGSKRFLSGPPRVVCFCLLGVILPSVLISIPLLMRFVFYGKATYHLNPSDMRIMDRKISTTWCQSERVVLNTTFTAYVTDGVPPLVKIPEPLSIEKTMILPDDHKEYWGFYLHKGSTYKVHTCARSKGGTLLIVRGRNHLDHCAYIGDADSAGDSDEFSNSNSNESGKPKHPSEYGSKRNASSAEEMSIILSKIRNYIRSRPKGVDKLKEQLFTWILADKERDQHNTDYNSSISNRLSSVENIVPISEDPTEVISPMQPEQATSTTSTAQPLKIRHLDAKARLVLELAMSNTSSPNDINELVVQHGRIRRTRHAAEIRPDTDSGENGAFEESSQERSEAQQNSSSTVNTKTSGVDTPVSIWEKEHSHHTGVLNETYPNNDGSDSESESSFSSSEEALAKCEGVVASIYLQPDASCGLGEFDPETALFSGEVNASGYYYFIFGSENEVRDNFLRARFELSKYEFTLPEPLENCTAVKECRVPFDFVSNQKLVVQLPQPSPNRTSAWDEVYLGESECEPRATLYLIFVLIVPLSILMCAFQ